MTNLSLNRYFLSLAEAAGHDLDPEESEEWRAALLSVLEQAGPDRAKYLLDQLNTVAQARQMGWRPNGITPYLNTIPASIEAGFPGDLAIEERLGSIMRWNAMAMVVRANAAYGELGGHIASYASSADLFEVGFNHFFRAGDRGDLVFFQPHSAPGIYARAFLEGRLSEESLAHYRQELSAEKIAVQGLSSYPHPYLMPDFWQFPTGSMGIGPISAIFQARFMRYLQDRKLIDAALAHQQRDQEQQRVWGFFGDGEMDEPESMSALTLAAREGLDNLTFVINCNLQRLDGPVRGNGRIVDELEALFAGAGWNVIKLLWGSDWDGLFARDAAALVAAFANTVDGQMQTFAAKDGAFNREHFFGQNPRLQQLVQGMTDEQIDRLKRGGHDLVKIHAAYASACAHRGQPTVILAHTKKGFGMGEAGQGKMTTHQQKKLDTSQLLAFRDRFKLPLSDQQVAAVAFYKPADDSEEMRYLHERRARLGGYLPKRHGTASVLKVPPQEQWSKFALEAQGKEMSTTMAFVRMLGNLLKDKTLGPRIVPIVADEARTFGMANLFKQVGIYSSVGQRYEPEDIGSVLTYREATDGQILEEGISEASALASWTAAATAYSVHGQAMLPFYIYYSMFGFQRVGDQIWAAADQRARGFLIGATSGRTTLGGEGLQHQDGNSQLIAGTIPNCRSYDPAFAGELAVILNYGMREMLEQQRDVFYYITAMNESYPNPSLPLEAEAGVIQGAYVFKRFLAKGGSTAKKLTLLGSGAIFTEVLKAAEALSQEGFDVDVVSVTSWNELARDGVAAEQARLGLTPTGFVSQGNEAKASVPSNRKAWITTLLSETFGPIIAASDYVRALPEQIRAFIPQGRPFHTLGTDGFGRSDTRAQLREHFGVDARRIADLALRLDQAH
jgi:pyruvate dehydrogenase E1 component